MATASLTTLTTGQVLSFYDKYKRPAGMLLTGNGLITLAGWGTSNYTFQPKATTLSGAILTCLPEPGLRGLVLETGECFTGDVWIVGGPGVLVREDTDGSVRVDIIGDPLYKQVSCQETGGELNTPMLLTLNELPADKTGGIHLQVGTNYTSQPALRLNASTGQLTIFLAGT